MNDRLEIASRLLAFLATPSGLGTPDERRARQALEQADALIKMESETRENDDG